MQRVICFIIRSRDVSLVCARVRITEPPVLCCAATGAPGAAIRACGSVPHHSGALLGAEMRPPGSVPLTAGAQGALAGRALRRPRWAAKCLRRLASLSMWRIITVCLNAGMHLAQCCPRYVGSGSCERWILRPCWLSRVHKVLWPAACLRFELVGPSDWMRICLEPKFLVWILFQVAQVCFVCVMTFGNVFLFF